VDELCGLHVGLCGFAGGAYVVAAVVEKRRVLLDGEAPNGNALLLAVVQRDHVWYKVIE